MSTNYGKFYNFCQDSTLPVCNLFQQSIYRGQPTGNGFEPGACVLSGIPLSGNRNLRNLGVIILCGIAIFTTLFLLWMTQRKKAAVGRREMQLFLLGYIFIEICEIFSIGGFPVPDRVRIAFSGLHLGFITATTWMLMLNGAVGYQLIEDGNLLSLILTIGSAAALFLGTAYIALDTGFGWTSYWQGSQVSPDRSYSLYTLYLLCPIVFLFIYFVLETFLVLKILRETRPMIYLTTATLLFIIAQIFDFVISRYICNGTHGKIDGSLFEAFFTLLAVVMIWIFWSSITEDDWPQLNPGEAPPTNA